MDSALRKEGGYYPSETYGRGAASRGASSRSPRAKVEYNPNSPGEKEYFEKVREIRAITDPDKLIEMRRGLKFSPNERLVRIYGERGHRLRYTAALCWEMFKQYVKLKGGRTMLLSTYRPASLQRKLWNNGLAKRRRKFPNYTQAQLERENSKWVARPGRSWHQSGGTADIAVYYKGKRITSRKFRGSRAAYNYAMRTGDLSRLSAQNRAAIRDRQTLNREYAAEIFLGVEYYKEGWHYSFDKKRETGRRVYSRIA
jgi:hypothetical protein